MLLRAAPTKPAALTQVFRRMRGRQPRPEFMGYAIRTDRYRYIEWGGGEHGVQLYDYETDPQEFRNLAEDPVHTERIAEMKRLLRARLGTAK